MTLLYCKSRRAGKGTRSDWRRFGSQRQKASSEWARGEVLGNPQDSQAGEEQAAGHVRKHFSEADLGNGGSERRRHSPFLSLALGMGIFRAVMGVKVFLLPPDIDLINCRTDIPQTQKVSAEKNSKQWALVGGKKRGGGSIVVLLFLLGRLILQGYHAVR